jgi:hypothetical protein
MLDVDVEIKGIWRYPGWRTGGRQVRRESILPLTTADEGDGDKQGPSSMAPSAEWHGTFP